MSLLLVFAKGVFWLASLAIKGCFNMDLPE